jgi:hypothetical protein
VHVAMSNPEKIIANACGSVTSRNAFRVFVWFQTINYRVWAATTAEKSP